MNAFRYGALISALLLTSPPVNAAEDLSDRWLDLWTRCRIAIETGQDFDATGLTMIGTDQIEPNKRSGLVGRTWGQNGGRFIVAEGQMRGTEQSREKCDVRLAPDAESLSPQEQASLVRRFLIERTKLISLGKHKMFDPAPIAPIIGLGVGPISRNVNNCSVISMFMFEPASDFFRSGTGEQFITDCSKPD